RVVPLLYSAFSFLLLCSLHLFFLAPPPTQLSPLSLHDALPISSTARSARPKSCPLPDGSAGLCRPGCRSLSSRTPACPTRTAATTLPPMLSPRLCGNTFQPASRSSAAAAAPRRPRSPR